MALVGSPHPPRSFSAGMVFRSLVLAASTPVLVGAVGLSSSTGAACLYIANNFTNYPFDCPPPDINYRCRCRCPPFLGTVMLCVDDASSTYETITLAYHYVMEVCRVQAGAVYLFEELVDVFNNATHHVLPLDQVPTRPRLLHRPVHPLPLRFHVSQRSVDSLVSHRVTSTVYGGVLLAYWGGVVALGAASAAASGCFRTARMAFNHSWVRWVRRNIVDPKLLDRNVLRERPTALGRWLTRLVLRLPSRIQALAVLGYVVLVCALTAANYRFVMPNSVFLLLCVERNVYIGDRAGILAVLQLPLVVAFAGRNNLLVLLTGWPYRTFVVFHQWVSRVVFVLVVLHACFYYDLLLRNKDYVARWGLTKWRFAHVALFSGALLLVMLHHRLRLRVYEFFKLSHQVLAVLFVVGTWHHCVTLGWMEFLYAAVAVWGGDHVVRWFRIAVLGGVVWANCEVVGGHSNDPGHAPIIRITITHSGYWRHYPGCYVFVYFLRPGVCWQLHPFTTIDPALVSSANQLVMLVQVRAGVTRRLLQYMERATQQAEAGGEAGGGTLCTATGVAVLRTRIPVLVEGPYGSPVGFNGYHHALFVAGGIGFTVVYTLAVDLARLFNAARLRGDVGADSHSITLYWIVTSAQYVAACAGEVAVMLELGAINTAIHITREDGPQENGSGGRYGSPQLDKSPGDEYKPALPVPPSLPPEQYPLLQAIFTNQLERVRVHWRLKPAMKSEVADKAGALGRQGQAVAVVACGPDRLNCDVRDGTTKTTRTAAGRVDYYEEKLLW